MSSILGLQRSLRCFSSLSMVSRIAGRWNSRTFNLLSTPRNFIHHGPASFLDKLRPVYKKCIETNNHSPLAALELTEINPEQRKAMVEAWSSVLRNMPPIKEFQYIKFSHESWLCFVLATMIEKVEHLAFRGLSFKPGVERGEQMSLLLLKAENKTTYLQSHLKTLELIGCGIDDTAAKALATKLFDQTKLKWNKPLLHLNLASNIIGKEGLTEFANYKLLLLRQGKIPYPHIVFIKNYVSTADIVGAAGVKGFMATHSKVVQWFKLHDDKLGLVDTRGDS